ncbi:DUF3343 domain-containing protein [bacterium]|nr:DUF3343 domain-containing protein [bacterium]
MAKKFYILVENNTQGMAIHHLLDEKGIENHISPTPRLLTDEAPCGMSILLPHASLEMAQACLNENEAKYIKIASLDDPFEPKRDRYM